MSEKRRNPLCGRRSQIPQVEHQPRVPTEMDDLLSDVVEGQAMFVLAGEGIQLRWSELMERSNVESDEELFDAALQALEWLLDARDNKDVVYRGKKVDDVWNLEPFKIDL